MENNWQANTATTLNTQPHPLCHAASGKEKNMKGACTTIFSTPDIIQSARDRGNKMTIRCTEGSSGSLVRLPAQCFCPEGAENIWHQQLDLLGLWQQVCIFLVQCVKLKRIGKATQDKYFDLTTLCCGDEILQVLSFSLLMLARSNTFCCTWPVLFMHMFCYTLAEKLININSLILKIPSILFRNIQIIYQYK